MLTGTENNQIVQMLNRHLAEKMQSQVKVVMMGFACTLRHELPLPFAQRIPCLIIWPEGKKQSPRAFHSQTLQQPMQGRVNRGLAHGFAISIKMFTDCIGEMTA